LTMRPDVENGSAPLEMGEKISLRDYEPDLPPLPKDLPEDEEAMRIVCLVKNNQPLTGAGREFQSHWDTLRQATHCRLFSAGGRLAGGLDAMLEGPRGATIRRDDVTGEIYIARVIHGGLVDRSGEELLLMLLVEGLLHAGDRLVEVNGQPVFGLEPEQIIQILVSTHLLSYYMLAHSHGTIMFKVVPITDRPVNNQTMLYVRAMVDYNPHVDPSIPCADAGMAFRKGDILEIVDQSDTLWWQAVKLPSISACAGLIPSTSLLKRKQKELWWSQPYHPHTCVKTLSTVDEGEHSVESLEIHKPVEDELIAIDEKCVEADEEAFESGRRAKG
ncbi:hypothetical protein cypCar_00038619, partial [Cyprinus carpio]